MKITKKLAAVVLSLCMVLSLIPIVALQASAFSQENFKAEIKEIHIGAPITGLDGKRYYPVDVHFTAKENLSDSEMVYFLEGHIKAILKDGKTAESVKGLGMTLMGPLKPDVPLENSNMWTWNWKGTAEGGGEGVIKYNVPILEEGEEQTVEKNDGTGLTEVNGVKEGDKLVFQNETVVNTSQFPPSVVDEVFPDGPSVFSEEKTVTIPPEKLLPYTVAYDTADEDETTEPATADVTEPATAEVTEPETAPETEPVTGEATEPETVAETEPVTGEATEPETTPVTEPETVAETEPMTVEATEPATAEATQPETGGVPTTPTGSGEVVVDPRGEVIPTLPVVVDPTQPGYITPTYPVIIDPTNPGGGTVNPTQPVDVTPTTPITTDPVSNTTTVEAKAPKTTLKIGETTKINVDVQFGAGETKFTSETPKIISVSKDGTVKGLSAGKGYVLIENNGAKQRIGFNINKKSNTMTVKAKTVKAKADKKTTIKRTKAFKIKNAKGKLVFKKIKGNKKIKVNKKTGKITVKKGLKKGKTYKVKIKITAKGNLIFAEASKTVTVKIKIK